MDEPALAARFIRLPPGVLAAILCLSVLTSAEAPTEEGRPALTLTQITTPWTGDLDGMVERRMVRVLTAFSKTQYFIDRGTPRGTAYDQGRLLEAHLNKIFGRTGAAIDVIAYSVSRRTRELGIRMAVAASRRRILTMVLGQGLRLAAAGAIAGGLVALASARVLASLLYGISPLDPAAYAAACGLLLAVACLANLAPAIVAARTDPLRALRRE